MTTASYRSDITGLRAVAVLSVLIFHIFPNSLPGGYLGVDMFFVISGYLITLTLINENQRTTKISLIAFYKRRIFRIAPATIFIIFLTLLLANLFMILEMLTKTSNSAIFSVFGFANVYFYKYLDTSYFAPNVALNPLLHLWSLGVEEQFYLIFPLIFMFLIKYTRLFCIVLTIMGIISVIWASYIVKTNPMFAYYMLPTRAFALILGCLSALYCTNYHKNISPKFATILSIASVMLIGLAISLLSNNYKLPSYLSLLVVIPTAWLIIIGFKNSTFIHKVLGSVYLKHIGLWSFSIYLIHWLILAFYKSINGLHISIPVGIAIFIASILLGGLSYYFIEQTLRFKRWNIIFALIAFIFIPFTIAQTNYYFAKKGGIRYASITPKLPIDEYTCHQTIEYANKKNNLFKAHCTHNADLEPNVILWGDSNSYHYIPALNHIAKNLGFGFRNISHSSCPGLTTMNKEHYVTLNYKIEGACNYNSAKAYELVKKYDIVILANSWINIYNASSPEVLRKELEKTLNNLSKTTKLILVLGNSPIPDNLDLQHILKNSAINNNKNNVNGINNIVVFEANKIVQETVKKFPKAYYVDFNNILCDETKCIYKKDRNSFYAPDSKHLSVYASNYIGEHYINNNIENVFYKIKELYKENPKDTFFKNTDNLLK